MEDIDLPVFSGTTKVKVSDLIASYFEKIRVRDIFVLTGGCAVHIIDSIGKNKNLRVVPMLHEQSCAMAADSYSRVSAGNFSVVVTTSGPGATNLLTGVCCSYYDSVPVLLITGQVPSSQLKQQSELRQFGFQETDVRAIFNSVTKFCAQVTDPNEILFQLDQAYVEAKSGRPGPVLLDICDDVQRSEVIPDTLKRFLPSKSQVLVDKNFQYESDLKFIQKAITESKRPLIVLGGGLKNPRNSALIQKFLSVNKIPYLLTWGAIDLVPHDSEYFAGTFGVTSTRSGNFVIQNADLIIGLGVRFDSHEIGTNSSLFAPNAGKILIDIDQNEINKFQIHGPELTRGIHGDSQFFLSKLLTLQMTPVESAWLEYINEIKSEFFHYKLEEMAQESRVNPYFFMSLLSNQIREDAIIIPDCGSNLIWAMQGLKIRSEKNLFFSAFNHSPMGYSLPAAFGANTYFQNNRQVICITGDGGLMINLQELATFKRHASNLKIFIMNNHGHGIIQGTQDAWLEGRYVASNYEGGLPDPDYQKIIESFEIPVTIINTNLELEQKLNDFLNLKGTAACIVEMQEGSQIYPKLLSGNPIHDASPRLSKEKIDNLMRISYDK